MILSSSNSSADNSIIIFSKAAAGIRSRGGFVCICLQSRKDVAFTGLDKTFVWKFVGMKNFRRVFMDPNTPIIVRNTLIYVGVCISATLVIDLFFAIMTTYFIKSERSASIFKGILMIPMITHGGWLLQ